MPANPEQAARENIDRLLIQAGWSVQDIKSTNLHAGAGVAMGDTSSGERLQASTLLQTPAG